MVLFLLARVGGEVQRFQMVRMPRPTSAAPAVPVCPGTELYSFAVGSPLDGLSWLLEYHQALGADSQEVDHGSEVMPISVPN
jgi:hypothetical protein